MGALQPPESRTDHRTETEMIQDAYSSQEYGTEGLELVLASTCKQGMDLVSISSLKNLNKRWSRGKASLPPVPAFHSQQMI